MTDGSDLYGYFDIIVSNQGSLVYEDIAILSQ
jgi:hypothetical protein